MVIVDASVPWASRYLTRADREGPGRGTGRRAGRKQAALLKDKVGFNLSIKRSFQLLHSRISDNHLQKGKTSVSYHVCTPLPSEHNRSASCIWKCAHATWPVLLAHIVNSNATVSGFQHSVARRTGTRKTALAVASNEGTWNMGLSDAAEPTRLAPMLPASSSSSSSELVIARSLSRNPAFVPAFPSGADADAASPLKGRSAVDGTSAGPSWWAPYTARYSRPCKFPHESKRFTHISQSVFAPLRPSAASSFQRRPRQAHHMYTPGAGKAVIQEDTPTRTHAHAGLYKQVCDIMYNAI